MWNETPKKPATLIPMGSKVLFNHMGDPISSPYAGVITGFDESAVRYVVAHSEGKWSYVRHDNIVAVW